jgi:hypothetical protein
MCENPTDSVNPSNQPEQTEKTCYRLTVAFEILNCPLVLFGRSARAEGTQIPAFAGLWIFFPRVKAILARS